MHADTFYHIALTQTPLIGSVNAKHLIAYCGGVREIFELKKQDLMAIEGIGPKIAESIHSGEGLRAAEREMRHLEGADIQPIFFLSNEYPKRLLEIHNAPILIYFTGSNDQLLHHQRIVSIVGTRKPTHYGRQLCEQLVEGLKAYNCLIVSGLAFGIDIVAHKTSVEKSMPTLGVLGHGLGRIYPEEHRSTANKMRENGGLVTEFLFETGPDRMNFPMRNRIIAGLADATVVVETAQSGGSMISANLAAEFNREVFAFPGRVRDPFSVGCNFLIKSNRASLIENAKDLADAMQWPSDGMAAKPKQAALLFDLSDQEKKVIDIVRNTPRISIDDLLFDANLGSETVAVISQMEMKGLLNRLPGHRYELA